MKIDLILLVGCFVLWSIIMALVGLGIGEYYQEEPLPYPECPNLTCPSFQPTKCQICPEIEYSECIGDFLDQTDYMNKQKELIREAVK